ncbi:UNVERIFIED_CONTAM: hypothetical protein Slati_2198800 [Sesamum latifolium]|uniref:Reverse transcriptase zinc-binding domain-containing protein n=1 Tax=Sesamum latifolium TaxID=2727402 RepID=A0AAW2WXU6_9LAMI
MWRRTAKGSSSEYWWLRCKSCLAQIALLVGKDTLSSGTGSLGENSYANDSDVCYELLPLADSFLKELESKMADFFWHVGEASKIYWRAWSQLCKSKSEGGAGFCRLSEINTALFAKQAWRIAMCPGNILHDVISQKYFPGSIVVEARLGSRSSFTWSTKTLSQAGWAVLVKTVMQTIPTYAMNGFRLPDSFLKELESKMVDFFWHGGEASKIHWRAWSQLCKSKSEGGVGFHRLTEVNTALLAKQAWRIAMCRGNVLDDVTSQKYFPGSTVVEARLGSRPSFTWCSIWASRDILVAGIDGKKEFAPMDADCILEGSCSQSGRYWNFIWKSKDFPKVVLFAWKCVWEALPTSENLKKRGVPIFDGCVSCSADTEDVFHVLFFCSFAHLVWVVSGFPWGALRFTSASVEDWFRAVHGELDWSEWELFLNICWALWWARNQRIFDGEKWRLWR